MPKQDLKNKVIWITGASSGLGQALAEVRFTRWAGDFNSTTCSRAGKIKATLVHSEQHLCIGADITDESQVLHAYEQVLQSKGQIDWLINNAGLSQRALIADTTMQTERAIMEVDYFSQVFITKTVLPTFLKQKSGKIAFVSSVAGLLGTQYRASYSAAKAAIHMWANSLRAEVADQGVAVSVIFPGFIKTNVSINALNGEGKPQGHDNEATANGLTPEVFAKTVVNALLKDEEYIVVGGAKENWCTGFTFISYYTL